MGGLSASALVILFSTTIILSYFFTLISKRSGIPSVLLLIFLGIFINISLVLFGVAKPNLLPILEVLGVVGLILILLEAALDLRLLRSKISVIIKSILVSLLGLGATSYVGAELLNFLLDIPVLNALLYTIPLSILSSAIILPSIDGLRKHKQEFMIYESTFSDIWGIIGFYTVLKLIHNPAIESIQNSIFQNLFLSVFLSVVLSYILIYIFQKISGPGRLFLLIAVLLLLYAIGQFFNLSSLLIILIFGLILNNYTLFFKGPLVRLLDLEKTESVLDDFKVVTSESAFVVRTFFFIIFGWSVSLITLFNFQVIFIGFGLLLTIYLVRLVILFLFNGFDVSPQLFLAPRGLITILLFFAIPEDLKSEVPFEGVLLFIILSTSILMSWFLVSYKKKQLLENPDVSTNSLDESSIEDKGLEEIKNTLQDE